MVDFAQACRPRSHLAFLGSRGIIEQILVNVKSQLPVLHALRNHPCQSNVRQPGVLVSPTDIRMHPGKPHLEHLLALVPVRDVPHDRLKGRALLVQRQRMERIAHIILQDCIPQLQLLARVPAQPRLLEPNRIPHPDDLDREPRQGVAEPHSFAPLRIVSLNLLVVEIIIHERKVIHAPRGQQTPFADEPGDGTGSVRAAREAKEIDLVAVVVVVGQEAVRGSHVGADAQSGHAWSGQ